MDQAGLFCNDRLGYKIGFKFTDQSVDTLLQVVSNMPYNNAEDRHTLLIDESFKDVDLEKISQLGQLAEGRIYLEICDDY